MAISRNKIDLLQKGLVIPAHPLALTAERELDEKRQRRLTKYYLKAGVGGLAVGVHTTQFAIRDPAHNFLEKVFALTAEEVNRARMDKAIIKVAGISGTTGQAILEAQLAYKWGYDLVLLSSNGLGDWTEDALLDRAREIAQVMPLFGFYLQPAVGGRILSFDFWKDFAEIPEVQAIKIAPFNRYQTLDVVRAVVHSSRNRDIALYTGNDDNIVGDLLTTYNFETPTGKVSKEIVGGLLGHWAFWTRRAVELLEQIHQIKKSGKGIPPAILSLGQQITDANAAVFDATNQFAGCIPGIHAILHRQGLLNGIWCLDAGECLSAGQQNEIDRIYSEYPELNDDDFVQAFLASGNLIANA